MEIVHELVSTGLISYSNPPDWLNSNFMRTHFPDKNQMKLVKQTL